MMALCRPYLGNAMANIKFNQFLCQLKVEPTHQFAIRGYHGSFNRRVDPFCAHFVIPRRKVDTCRSQITKRTVLALHLSRPPLNHQYLQRPTMQFPSCIPGEKLSRPLGLFERVFIEREKMQDWGSVTHALHIESDTKLNPETVQKALILLVKRYPALRMRVTEENNTLRFQEMENPFNIDFQVLVDATDDWVTSFSEDMNRPHSFNIQHGPLWRIALVKEVFDSSKQYYMNVLIFSAHHVILDGLSVLSLNKQLLEYVSRLDRGEDITVESMPLTPSRDDLIGHLSKPNLFQKLFLPLAFALKRAKDTIIEPRPRNMYLSVFPPVVDRDPSVQKKTCMLPRSLSLDETRAVVLSSKANKCTVHGAIIAATHLAMARILLKEKDDLKSPITMDTVYTLSIRQDCQPEVLGDVFGAYVAFDVLPGTEVPSKITGREDFWKFAQESIKRVHSRVQDGKHYELIKPIHCIGIDSYVAMSNPDHNAGRIGPVFNLTNIGRFEFGKEFPYTITGSHLCVKEHIVGTLFTHTIVTINGRMYWTLTYHINATTKQQAEELVDLSIDILKEYSC